MRSGSASPRRERICSQTLRTGRAGVLASGGVESAARVRGRLPRYARVRRG